MYKKHPGCSDIFRFIITGFNQIFQLPITSLFLIVILSFSLFLPVVINILWNNTGVVADKLNKSAEISIYLTKRASPKFIDNLVNRLKQDNNIAQVQYISPQKGGAEFVEKIGFREILAGFKTSPLPATIIVYPKLREWSFFQIPLFINELQQLREVDTVTADINWIKYCQNLLLFGQNLLLIIFVLFGFGSMVVMFYVNYTIPWIILSRKSVTKGALHCQCLWYGLISSLTVIVVINFAIMKLQKSDIFLQGLGVKGGVLLIFAGVLISALGSNYSIKNT